MDFAASPDYESISAQAAKLAAAFDDDYWSAHDERKEFPWEFTTPSPPPAGSAW